MSIELEAKFKLDDIAPVRRRLTELGAQFVGRVLETNTFFDDDARSLLSSDRGLRLRHNHDFNTHADTYVVTYKGPKQPGEFKSREELEVQVASDQIGEIFAQLGLDPMLAFEKRRESWKLHDCKIELDELPYLGFFIEIEAPSPAQITTIRDQLGLTTSASIKTAYSTLLIDNAQARGHDTTMICFPQ